ncbi:ArnT family glycosyltransferase [Actinospica sp.]|uniref:ArnT family glycosyltransferase n=1 Tax=Actinospica sp. TaxID=1872142 RepID=UPI002CBFD2F1|nr:glycosyltransferase family 39 protein [Actinospica sp.]HWG23913.1 glycosyltransferase family 39 protein [Actinospica sp.]
MRSLPEAAPVPATGRAEDPPTSARHGLLGRLAAVPWPLFALLGVQAALSVRLLRLNTAFVDEATYLYAGHQELDHWIHGWPIPAYSTYFSGAPTIYPPIAAVADNLGGLVGARLLSLAFMLWATAMLWACARMLFGRIAAVAACAIFMSLGPTQALGAFATYDPMAFALMVTAVYCALRAGDASEEAGWWPLCAVLLALADATKYTMALWDPFVLAILVIRAHPQVGHGAKIRRAAGVAALAVSLLALGLAAGGAFYIDGITSTTLTRAAGLTHRTVIVHEVLRWVGWPLAFGALGLLVALLLRRSRLQSALLATLVLASVVAPLNQLRITTDTSLEKHVDFGAWFACLAAGYVVTEVSRALPGLLRSTPFRLVTASLITAAALLTTVSTGAAQADAYFHTWPNAQPVAEAMKRHVTSGTAQYLVEDYDVEAYYLLTDTTWHQWNNTWAFSYFSHADHKEISGVPAYVAAVKNHYFDLIVLDFGDTSSTDHAIAAAMAGCANKCGYHIVAEVPYSGATWRGQFTIWQYQGAR